MNIHRFQDVPGKYWYARFQLDTWRPAWPCIATRDFAIMPCNRTQDGEFPENHKVTFKHSTLNHVNINLIFPSDCGSSHLYFGPTIRWPIWSINPLGISVEYSATLSSFIIQHFMHEHWVVELWKSLTLRIQVCPKKGINPTILLLGWDWDHQTYSREGYGSLGLITLCFFKFLRVQTLRWPTAAKRTDQDFRTAHHRKVQMSTHCHSIPHTSTYLYNTSQLHDQETKSKHLAFLRLRDCHPIKNTLIQSCSVPSLGI